MTIRSFTLVTALLCVAGTAAEHEVTEDKFIQRIHIHGTVIPTQTHPISITPESWQDFTIESVLPQGSIVKKGDRLVVIDSTDLDEKIIDVREDREAQKLKLARKEAELERLHVDTERKLAAAELRFQRTQEDHNYFFETTLPEAKKSAELDVTIFERNLAYNQEELDQLLKMYAEDNLTEETEEIILLRTRHRVEYAKKELHEKKLLTQHILEVNLPRKSHDWKEKLIDAAHELEQSKTELPRSLQLKIEEVEKERRTDEKWEKHLNELIADRAMMDITAPADGVLYYGTFKNGQWEGGHAAKILNKGQKIPARTDILTIVPADSPASLQGSISAHQRQLIGLEKNGSVAFEISPWQRSAVTLEHLSPQPELNGSFNVRYSSSTPLPHVAAKGKIIVRCYEQDKALSLPVAAVKVEDDGTYTAELKMADGKSETTLITVGRAAEGRIEILSGLSAGQIVLTKD